jgi:AmiR/NasT family two-component response regulator
MSGAASETRFKSALASRDVIGQAKGILMIRNDVAGHAAFNLLAQESKETNTKLVDVARWLVAEHEERLAGG